MTLVSLANGQQLAVEQQGDVQDQPLIFINGFGSYKEIWTGQLDMLAQLSYHVIRYDFRGQGGSAGYYAQSLDDLGDDLAGLIEKLQLDQPILVGHSMGCSVIWNLRQRYPSLAVKAIVLVDQPPKMINDSEWPYGFVGVNENNWQEKYATKPAVRETLHGFVDRIFRPFSIAQTNAPFSREKGLPLLKSHFRADWRQTACQETSPTLFISAKQSPYYRPGYGAWVAERNAVASQVLIDDCGHDIMAEVPDRFNQTLRHFLLKTRGRREKLGGKS